MRIMHTVFSPRLSQGMTEGRGLGVVYGHIKAFGLFPFSHQRSICAEGLQDRHALSMPGRTLAHLHHIIHCKIKKKIIMQTSWEAC